VAINEERAAGEERRSGHSTGSLLAIGAIFAGLSAFFAALLRLKLRIADDESPIIIKSGSLSVAIKDGTNATYERKPKFYTVTSDEMRNKNFLKVIVAELEAGFPSDKKTFTRVSSVVLQIVKGDDDSEIDVVTMKFETSSSPRVLKVEATNDPAFGTNMKVKNVNSPRRHNTRFVNKEISGDKGFEIASITVNHSGGSKTFKPGHDHALAFQFS
jgi:hypothetical protein